MEYFDPVARAAEKRASREEDERALASGEITREQLCRRNYIFYGLKTRISLRGSKPLK
jgi:hypothetical protein